MKFKNNFKNQMIVFIGSIVFAVIFGAFVVPFTAAFSFAYSDLDKPTYENIKSTLKTNDYDYIGKVEHDFVESPHQYAFSISDGVKNNVFLLPENFGEKDYSGEGIYFKLTPQEELTEQDKLMVRFIEGSLSEFHNNVVVHSKHYLYAIKDGEDELVKYPFYKVTFKHNQDDFLFFYGHKEHIINIIDGNNIDYFMSY